nr:MAG TPA: hypothetical protein [Caudoviricetes sp.]
MVLELLNRRKVIQVKHLSLTMTKYQLIRKVHLLNINSVVKGRTEVYIKPG